MYLHIGRSVQTEPLTVRSWWNCISSVRELNARLGKINLNSILYPCVVMSLILKQRDRYQSFHFHDPWQDLKKQHEAERRGLGWISGKSISPRGWLSARTGSPGKWSHHQACLNSRSAWTTFSGIHGVIPGDGPGVGLNDSDRYHPTQHILLLWFYSTSWLAHSFSSLHIIPFIWRLVWIVWLVAGIQILLLRQNVCKLNPEKWSQ